MIKRQSGNSHLLLIISIIIALVGAVGYVALQQTQENKNLSASKSATQTAREPTDQLSEVASDQTMGTGVTLLYPATWERTHEATESVEQGIIEGARQDTTKLTSPDGEVMITLQVITSERLGSTCGDQVGQAALFPIVSIKSADIAQYPGARYVSYIDEYTADDGSKLYDYEVGAFGGDTKNVTIGDSSCLSFPNGSYFESTKGNAGLVQLNATFTRLSSDEPGIIPKDLDLKEIEDVLSSPTAKTAEAIIRSLSVK